MCDRLGLLVASVLFTSAAAPGVAQDVARQRVLVDSLARDLKRAEAALDALGRPSDGPRDTIRVGALVVVAPQARTTLATTAMERAWMVLAAHLGSAAEAFAHDTFELRPIRPGAPMFGGEWRVLAVRDDVTAEGVSSRLLQLATQALIGQRPAPWSAPSTQNDALHVWFGPAVPFALEPRELLERTHLALVTSLSVAAERCYLGDIAWCRDALGLAPTDDPIRRWYDASGRRALVGERSDRFYPAWTRALYDQCTNDGADLACAMLLDALPDETVRQVFQPVTQQARQLLLITALARGGPRAVERLHAAQGSIEERLIAAAGEPIDSLLSSWRAAVMTAAPSPPFVATGARWMALVWVALLAGLAIGITRWS